MIAGRQPKWVWSESTTTECRRPAPTQPSAFHGRVGDTPVRALGNKRCSGAGSLPSPCLPRALINTGPPLGAVSADPAEVPQSAWAPPTSTGFSLRAHPVRTLEPGQAGALEKALPATTGLVSARVPMGRRTGGLREGPARGPHLEQVHRHRSGMFKQCCCAPSSRRQRVDRQDPTTLASEPLNPVQRPSPGPLPAQARLARSSEPILIPKLRI